MTVYEATRRVAAEIRGGVDDVDLSVGQRAALDLLAVEYVRALTA